MYTRSVFMYAYLYNNGTGLLEYSFNVKTF